LITKKKVIDVLFSFTLALAPTQSTRLVGFYGREVRAWFLDELTRYAPDLVATLHDESDPRPRPYTVSGLIVPRAGRRLKNGKLWLVAQNECLVRISSMDRQISELLLENVIPGLPQRIQLKWNEFSVQRVVRDNNWWGQAEWNDFARTAEQASAESVTLNFASPTAFRDGSVDHSLPTPYHVFRSLWWRWNTFAPAALQIDSLWPQFAERCIVVSDFRLRSMKVYWKRGRQGAATGATGQVTYRLLTENHCGEYAHMRADAVKVLNNLGNFALYSGVGHHTTIGLGQTRRLPHSNGPISDSGEPDEH
jgi:CRISPR-associated endoribonuclease Cas6